MNYFDFVITGGSGFIGSSMVWTILKKNPSFQILIIDNNKRGNNISLLLDNFPENIVYRNENVQDLQPICYKDMTVKYFIHLAAYAYVGEGEIDREMYISENILSLSRAIDIAKITKAKRFIFSSTCAVYGEKNETLTEELLPVPTSIYGISKLVCEKLLKQSDIWDRTTIFRFFNVAGSLWDAPVGERHNPETHLIPLIFKKIAIGEVMEIFGNDYATKDGTCEREYVHVKDIINAHFLAINNPTSKSKVYNLGTNEPISNYDIYNKIKEKLRIGGKVHFKSRREGDMAKLISSYTKIKNELNWQPCHSNIDLILNDYHYWFKINAQS